jgi:predicted nuclease of restriction endonuclease-like (RecB) superfamily
MTELLAPDSYGQFLADLKGRIRAAQLRASLAVNRELVLLYWQLGRDILVRQQRENWGAKVIDGLAADLKRAFPDMKGFSPRNLKYMRAFAEAWPDEAIVQAVLAQITWYHNLAILEKLATAEDRLWYARATIHHGWSRNVLVLQIEAGRLKRQGKRSRISIALCPRHNRISRVTLLKIPTTSISSRSAMMLTSVTWSADCSSTSASFFSNWASGSRLWEVSTGLLWATRISTSISCFITSSSALTWWSS